MKRSNNLAIVVLSHMDWSSGCDYIKQMSLSFSQTIQVVVFNPLYFPSVTNVFLGKRYKLLNHVNRNLTYVRSIGLVPFQRLKIINGVNRFINLLLFSIFLKYKFNNKKIIFWTFHYSLLPSLEFLKTIVGGKVVYDRPDQMASIEKRENKTIKARDNKMVNKANHVIVNSPLGLRYIKKINKQVSQAPWGCEPTMFASPKISKKKANMFKKIPKPRLGFVAPLNFRVNYQLLYSLASRNKNWSFILIGGLTDENSRQNEIVNTKYWLSQTKKHPNIYMSGHLDKKHIPAAISQLDIGLVLYDAKQEYNRGSNPMKVYEYLAAGKPVVSTPIEALINHNHLAIKIAKDVSGFENHIKHLLQASPNLVQACQKVALENSWKTRTKFIINNILKK